MVAIAHQAALAVEDTRYYSAMVQAERLAAVGQTIATLSHHIKNILQGIRGGSYLIEMGLSEHDETVVGKGWKIVEKNQNKISALVHGHAHLQQGARARPAPPPTSTRWSATCRTDAVAGRRSSDVELDWQPADDMPDAGLRSRGDAPGRAQRGHQRHRRRRRDERSRAASRSQPPTRAEEAQSPRHRQRQRAGHPAGADGRTSSAPSSPPRRAAAPAWGCR